jgi:acid phosphatase type 7
MRRWFFLALLAAALAYSSGWLIEGYTPADAAADSATVRVVAVGDIACPPGEEATPDTCQQAATAELAKSFDPDAVLLLGDIQYPYGALAEFEAGFAPSWGSLGARLKPAAGNHEWLTPGAVGYYRYFGIPSDSDSLAYYSFDMGAWHILSLDTDCHWLKVGCGPGTKQYQWLEQDLKTHPGQCTLAFYHHPIVTSGQFRLYPEEKAPAKDFFKLLAGHGVDLVLNGHDHIYERFGHLDGNGNPAADGVREIISGTGGRSHFVPFTHIERVAGSEFIDIKHFGVTRLQLQPGTYTWQFVDTEGQVLDHGSDVCHSAMR